MLLSSSEIDVVAAVNAVQVFHLANSSVLAVTVSELKSHLLVQAASLYHPPKT